MSIPLLGHWFGTVRVGNTSVESWFEVFDCHSTFEVILGKPWVQQVKAIHDYEADTIKISQGTVSETVPNHTPQQPATSTPETTIDKTTPQINKPPAETPELKTTPDPLETTATLEPTLETPLLTQID